MKQVKRVADALDVDSAFNKGRLVLLMEEQKYYKAFNKDLKCRDMQYEIGKEYTFDGKPIPCEQGFHFCKSIADCYGFYEMSDNTRICEVKPLGDVTTDDKVKYCTNKLLVVREIENPREESNKSPSCSGYCNSGDRNSGDCNSGNRNSGDWNSGNCNSGDWNSGNCNSGNCNSGDRNSGDCNSGNRNSGDWNSGNCNSGNCNSGDRNSGDCNSGNRNSGDWNSGNCNSGIFNTEKDPKINIFDAPSDWTLRDWLDSNACKVMSHCPNTHSEFIYEDNMSDVEKERHPEHKTIGGYIKTCVVIDADKQKWWDELSNADKQSVYDLPNFNVEKFKMCTGIEVEYGKERES